MTAYDVLIIGAGQAGPPLAHALAKAGRQVALAERKTLGGSCVNFGCTPTKAAIASARIAYDARRAAEFGIKVTGVEVDFAAVLRRARDVVLELRTGLERSFERTDNPWLLRGHARFDGRDGERIRVRVGDEIVSAAAVVIDTGTRSTMPSIDGLDQIDVIHAGNWLDRPELPAHLAILGGGVIAIEMSQFYRRMGSRVTIIERSSKVAGREDDDVASALATLLESEGIEIRLDTRTRKVERRGDGVRIHAEHAGRESAIDASHLLVATGRTPNTDDLGLDTVGVRRNERGFVEVDARLATNVPGIWAAGDIRGGPMFTHTSWDDYRVLSSQLAGDRSRTTDRIVPYAIFTDPELGRVGPTEAEARTSGRDVNVVRFDMAANGKAKEIGERAGFIKVIADRRTSQIVGAAVLAAQGGELIHLYVDLMNAGAPASVMRDAIHIHPTLAEAAQSAVLML
jgi:pyruvate/2-oxoglutarate dehydrogenase complex dihydrolipoamide dehydrogenase (E3) component